MAETTLIIGNKNYSSWSLRPWLVLKQLGINFDEERIRLFEAGFKDNILKHSAAGKVPVLKTAGLTIWESLAICEYLGEQHPELWPEDTADRALARSAVSEMHAGFMALRNELPMNCRAQQRKLDYSADAAADIQRIESLWQQCKQQSKQQGPWLFGKFGIVDAFYAPVAIRLTGYQIPLSPESEAYRLTQLSNPYLQQWIEAGQAEVEIIAEEEVGE
ncbi:glutathione S-transferase family protein [Motiliproteus sp. MSK22-1]|uniref:glutathione S-transferase family protein n=1 Tax=Motiliproteus sp. MSK22-1 TaxID=1897630 RepID=UPI0009780903|nr:glutathione S-transferase family protein [Motiliproteus sp. MSK22-1]OMH33601.1 glutathione S-transferase [Motiliproteus sp. MSK22-1]